MTVNISAQFSKDERHFNGLAAIEDTLVEKPLERHVIVAVVETKFYKVNVHDGNTHTPTVRLIQVEALDGDAAAQAKQLLDAAYRARTGEKQAPPQDDLFSHAGADAEADEG